MPCTDQIGDGLLRVPQVTKLLGLSRSKVYQLMERGELPYVKSDKARRVHRQCVEDYVRRHVVGPDPPLPTSRLEGMSRPI
jgi:excisionase family DNA binding protein